MMNRNDALIQCYLSGQVSESDWQRLLRDEPGLSDAYADRLAIERRLSRPVVIDSSGYRLAK